MKNIAWKYYKKFYSKSRFGGNTYKTLLFAEKFLDLANIIFAGYVLTILFQESFSLAKFIAGILISFGIYFCINYVVK